MTEPVSSEGERRSENVAKMFVYTKQKAALKGLIDDFNQ